MDDFLKDLAEEVSHETLESEEDLSAEDIKLEALSDDDLKEPGQAIQTLAFGWEIIKVVIIAVIIIIPIRYFVVQPFFVKGASMEETFQDEDYILIDEVTYRFRDPIRGDIIVFKFPDDERQFFIKRVIGLPGERIKVRNNRVTIFNDAHPDGIVLYEDYLIPGIRTNGSVETVLRDEEYFVLGDNRIASSDSRFWGAVSRDQITGRVFARAWPFGTAEFFDKPIYNIQ